MAFLMIFVTPSSLIEVFLLVGDYTTGTIPQWRIKGEVGENALTPPASHGVGFAN